MSMEIKRNLAQVMREVNGANFSLERIREQCREAYFNYDSLCKERVELQKDMDKLHRELMSAYADIDLVGKCFRNRNDNLMLCKVLSKVEMNPVPSDPLRTEYNCFVVMVDPKNPNLYVQARTVSFLGMFNLMESDEFTASVDEFLKLLLH